MKLNSILTLGILAFLLLNISYAAKTESMLSQAQTDSFYNTIYSENNTDYTSLKMVTPEIKHPYSKS